jgi:hypothetical protein
MSNFIFPRELSLKEGIRAGRFSFEKLVELLGNSGYITEAMATEGLALQSTTMEMLSQQDFDELFAFFYPGRLNEIEVFCIATDKGGPRGAFSYALYNRNQISHEQVISILRKENMEAE